MVRGKTTKRGVKVEKKSSGTKSPISKEKFEILQFGVERLKELEKELNSLDTRGFTKEDQKIRAKLKTVSEIPAIERELKDLKLKIRGKYRPRPKRKGIKYKDIQEDVEEIKEKFPDIKREIKKVGEKVEEIQKRKKGRLDPGVGLLVDLKFEEFIKEIKGSLSDRVKTKEKELDIVLKDDLKRREKNFKDKHLDLTRGFNEKKKELEKKYKMRVKKTLHQEVSGKFNIELQKKLDSMKDGLSKRYVGGLKEHAKKELEKQKKALEKQVRANLARKKQLLDKDFERIKLDQKKDLEEKRNKIKEKEERIAIQKDKLKIRRQRLAGELTKRKKALEKQVRGQFATKAKLIEREDEKIKNQKLELEKQKQHLEKKVRGEFVTEARVRKKEDERIEKTKKELEKQKQELNKQKQGLEEQVKVEFTRRVRSIKKDLEKKRAAERRSLEERKNRIKEKEERIVFQKDKLKMRRQNIDEEVERGKQKFKNIIVKEFHNKLKEELAAKEKKLRKQLRDEYKLRLKEHIHKHEEDMKKRKLMLELEFQKRMKQLLG